jgi:hypothetical protein
MRGSKILSWIVLGALTLGVLAMLSLVMYQQGVTANESKAQQAEITALQAGLKEANSRLEAQGEAPVPVPEVDDAADPPVVPLAPTQAQILSAFNVWCDLNTCRGKDGEDGDDAPAMTREEIFAGFSEWCSTDPRCVGQTGADGADSTVPGPQGRPPTPEEILAAVEVVCEGSDLCRGDAGKDGTNGTNGSDGRGIAKVECHTTGDWIFTYTDGTATTVPGPCRVVQPTPTPTPTASITKGR